MSQLYRDRAVVLRTRPLGETDRIITLFTSHAGSTDAVAKGVRRTKSKFGSRLEPFTVVDALFFRGRNLDTIDQAEIVNSYGFAIAKNVACYLVASMIAESAQRIGKAGKCEYQFNLLRGALRALANNDTAPPQVVGDAYLLRSVSEAGWEPVLGSCALCGSELGDRFGADVEAGGLLCALCTGEFLAPELPAYLLALKAGNWQLVNAAPPLVREQANWFITNYAQWHMDNTLRTLKVIGRQQ